MAERSLQEFVKNVSGESRIRIEHDYGYGFVRLHTSEAERRQAAQDIRSSEDIVLELLRNARDAHASHIFLSMSKEGSKRSLTVIDDGDGIPESMHETIFEPRVTSKLDSSHMDAWGLHGRGMALFSISQNAVIAKVECSAPNLGASIRVVSDTNDLSERTDQSSFPRFFLAERSSVNVRGPKNILRTACEFAIEARDSCAVHVGSPAEIAATLYSYGVATLSAVDRAFCKDAESLPLAKRLAVASDPAEFAHMSEQMGLDISTRTARRILDAQVQGTEQLIDLVVIEKDRGGSAKRPAKKRPASKALKLQGCDKAVLAESAREGFEAVADKYYLEKDVQPEVRVACDRVVITIPVVDCQF